MSPVFGARVSPRLRFLSSSSPTRATRDAGGAAQRVQGREGGRSQGGAEATMVEVECGVFEMLHVYFFRVLC